MLPDLEVYVSQVHLKAAYTSGHLSTPGSVTGAVAPCWAGGSFASKSVAVWNNKSLTLYRCQAQHMAERTTYNTIPTPMLQSLVFPQFFQIITQVRNESIHQSMLFYTFTISSQRRTNAVHREWKNLFLLPFSLF